MQPPSPNATLPARLDVYRAPPGTLGARLVQRLLGDDEGIDWERPVRAGSSE